MPDRISQRRLEELSPTLSERDKSVLLSVRQCRYLTTKQIRRLYFTEASSVTAGLKATNRTLNKLKSLALVGSLPRRVGGVRAGSGSLVWHLTEAGERLLRLDGTKTHPRRRFFEPSPHFLAHTLAVTECRIRLTEICGGGDLRLVNVETEPGCWRSYNNKGKVTVLRPDLFAVTICGEYEDRWFMEIDMNTEAPVRVVEKCRRYLDYYRSGIEQKRHEVFPLAVFIVPDAARKERVIAHIRDAFKNPPRIFAVITPDELEPLIRRGADGGSLC
jgi:hypothetical protein